MTLLTTAIFLVCLPSAIIDFALPKWKADEAFRIEDAYKWIHQATRGGEHSAPSEDGARGWLENEWKSLGPARVGELIWEPLCSGGKIGRLNLRPFRMRNGEPESLLGAFLTSARAYRSDGGEFIAAWSKFGKLLKKRPINKLTHAEWARLDAAMRSKNYPAVHHSKSYAEARAPAYRVITRLEMLKIVPGRP